MDVRFCETCQANRPVLAGKCAKCKSNLLTPQERDLWQGGTGPVAFIVVALVAVAAVFAFSIQNHSYRPDPPAPENNTSTQTWIESTTDNSLSSQAILSHAQKTYGWDCPDIHGRSGSYGDYFDIYCSNGKKLRVYPRAGKHPRITNDRGGYSGY